MPNNITRLALIISVLLILCVSCGQATPATSQPPSVSASVDSLYVDPSVDLGPISPYIYGSNFGPWTAVPLDMQPAALDSHITALRWPGGAWGDENDIQTYQLDTFVAFCKQIGAIPTISVRLLDGSPAAAAALVHYANIEMKYNIEYWSIGNEPTLFEQQTRQPYDTQRFM